jgi:hypothetical protein
MGSLETCRTHVLHCIIYEDGDLDLDFDFHGYIAAVRRCKSNSAFPLCRTKNPPPTNRLRFCIAIMRKEARSATSTTCNAWANRNNYGGTFTPLPSSGSQWCSWRRGRAHWYLHSLPPFLSEILSVYADIDIASKTANVFGLINGGTGGLIWMYVGTFSGFFVAVVSMAEMASM